MNSHISAELLADIQNVLQLEAQKQQIPQIIRQQTPQIIVDLIRECERLLARLQFNRDSIFYTSIQLLLGTNYHELPIGDRAINLQRAIACYQEVLRFWTPQTAPLEYANAQHYLGLAYSELPTENRATNLENAIACFQEALCFLTPRNAPLEYAMVQNGLGAAYGKSLTGDRADNLQRAIACFQEALRFFSPQSAPLDYAAAQNNLGDAYSNLQIGGRADNLQRAIACFQEALRFFSPQTAPLEYAAVQKGLGNAYSRIQTGDRADNLQRAIACFQEALRFFSPQITPLVYAITQYELGNVYSELPTGDRVTDLEHAIACFQEALRFFSPQSAPLDYAAAQNNLGNAYSNLPIGDRADNLQRAIACFQEALRFFSPQSVPLGYAMAQNNLGLAYRDLPTGDRADNLQRAIACFQEALHFLTSQSVPLDYAAAQNNLGNAYSDLPTGDRADNLQRAIACFQEALHVQNPEIVPLDYAKTQNHLGIIYRDLPTGDRAANLQRAITCFQEALRFFSPQSTPLEYAVTLNNLGLAYSDLPISNRVTNLQRAIACFQEALFFLSPQATPLDYAMVQDNLGLAYSDLPTGDRATNLEHAIACFQEALRFRTPESAPMDYATTQHNLGSVYGDLPTGDRATNLEHAIACFQEALRFRTSEANPLGYAATQNNLGNVYKHLPKVNQVANLKRAVDCYQKALRFWTAETFPFGYRMVNRNLAQLYFSEGVWQAAFDTYRLAMDAGEQLYRTGLSTESKASEAADNAILYRHAAFAAIRCGRPPQEALRILEHGKTRLLTEALHMRVRRPVQVPDVAWSAFEQASTDVRIAQAGRILLANEERDSVKAYQAYVKAVHDANTRLDVAIEQVRTYAPHFLKVIDISAVQTQLLDDQTALIAFCITEQGSTGFVLTQQSQEVQVVEVPHFTRHDLRQLLSKQDTNGWLDAYFHVLNEHTATAIQAWKAVITSVLAVLGERLLAPIISSLPRGITHLILLPSAELFLFPLHAVSLSDDSSTLVCECYQVSYAPSIEVLDDVRAKALQAMSPRLYAVINPESDPNLVFTPIEGEAIARFFGQQIVDAGQVGTKARVAAQVHGQTYVHFSCHGSYHWFDPPASGLDLADGRLSLAELQQGTLDLAAARLVTLSACETGIIDIFRGNAEEYEGLPAGFLLAGVPCVVSSLWAVEEFSTALLMEAFYHRHLVQKRSIAEALQEAQRWLRHDLTRDMIIARIKDTLDMIQRKHIANKKLSSADQHLLGRLEALKEELLEDYRPEECPFAHPFYWAAFLASGAV